MIDSTGGYVGRFAPSPTGPLHDGSMVAALASWLDARAHQGRWLIRIEDVDAPRTVAHAAERLLAQLAGCGLIADEAPTKQSQRDAAYRAALDRLQASGWAYPCGCTRRELETAALVAGSARQRHDERIYPGTCRDGLHGKPPRAMRVRCAQDGASNASCIDWHDRRLGAQHQDLCEAVGDFIIKRADRLWAYQLAVVVDDAAQGVTHVVRGEDLADNTPRQIHLQRLLGLPTPAYLHTPLVLAANGEKLSKSNGAAAIEPGANAVRAALRVFGMPAEASTVDDLLGAAVEAWRGRWQDRRFAGAWPGFEQGSR